jgi:cell division protein FtsI/penicillin-binding protein 2
MKNSATRIRIISIAFIVFALFLVTKLYFVQIVSGDVFKERADRQYVRPAGGVFDRGTIFFQSKDSTLMAAASLRLGFTVAINPKTLKNPESVYAKLSGLLTLNHDDFITRATKENDTYEEVAKRVDPDVAQKIDELHITGVNLYQEKWRYYPGENLASHVLGFVGYKGEDYSGRYGLENYYNDVLQRNDKNVYVNFLPRFFLIFTTVLPTPVRLRVIL